jgi:hypothetical protein
VAKEQASQVASTVGQGAKDVAGEVKNQAGSVLESAADEARDLVRDARTELRGQASQQTERAGHALRTLAGQIEALRDGRTEEAGAAADYARQISEKVQAVAGRLESGGLDGMVDDVRRFARRRPGTFLLGAAVAGFAVGRLVRSSAGGGDSQDGAATGYGNGVYGRPTSTGLPTSSTSYGTSADQLGTGPASLPASGPISNPYPNGASYPSEGATGPYPSGR